jgi:dATP pyrophosphohydrolase
MARAPFQVLVFLYRRNGDNELEYAIFQRADAGFWQGVAGGGEADETPLMAAMRETQEEAGIEISSGWIELQTTGSVPVTEFKGTEHWGNDLYVIPIYCFGASIGKAGINLSHEHRHVKWLSYQEAIKKLKFDIDHIALWELNQRIHGRSPRE